MALAPNKILAEFVGTFLLVMMIALNMGGGPFAVLSIAAVLMVCVYAMGPVSGGHFNPAVTLAIAMNKGIDAANAVMYVVAQIAGAQLARYLASVVYGPRRFWLGSNANAQGLLAEMTYTFMLVYVVLNVACRKEPNQAFGLAIGGVIVAGGYAAGPISGGAYNPAVASVFHPDGMLSCIIGELLGSCLAYLLFKKVVYKDGATVTTSAKLASEFIGTFMLVTTACLNVMVNPHSHAAALSIGFCLACMIFADGGVSGGHFNPLVTLALYFRGLVTDADVNTYHLIQLVAGFCGGIWAGFLTPVDTWSDIPRSIWILQTSNNVFDGAVVGKIWLEESVYTFVLCLVVLGVATVAKPASSAFNGLTIGLCVVAGGNAAGTSGGHLNAAVTMGMFSSDPAWSSQALAGMTNWCAYFGFQGLGSMLAAAVFRVVFKDEFAASAREYKVLPGDA